MVTMRASLLLPLAGLGAMLAGYTSTAIVDGKPQETVGTACRGLNGRWRIMDPREGQAGGAASGRQQSRS